MTRRYKDRRKPEARRNRLISEGEPAIASPNQKNTEKRSRQKKSGTRQSSSKINNQGGKSFFGGILRVLTLFCFICSILIIFGSILIREEVKGLMSRKITESSSVILSRPFPINPGISPKDSRLRERLIRLNYREVFTYPANPGEFAWKNDEIIIYLRRSWIKPEEDQRENIFELKLNIDGHIKEILDKESRNLTSVAWLEPEVLSVLGNSSERVVKNRTLNEFSEDLRNAILAIEDEHFYAHYGIDPFSIIRAATINFKAGKIVQGGSTLTQQLAKNLFFSSERSLFRKIKEAIAAILIESSYSKDKIFEMYLNEIFLGQEGRFAIHGFGEASLSFFGKEVTDITLAEAALLAGMVKAPSSYSPRKSLERAKSRQAVVLGRMEQLGFITSTQKSNAIKEYIKVFPATRSRRVAPYFVDYLQREVQSLLGDQSIEGGALRIISGLDIEYQNCAEQAVENGLRKLENNFSWLKKKDEPLQAALISVIPSSGEVRAWIGGRDFGESQFDRASLARRQPGSTFKPFVYLTALDGNLNQYRVAKTTNILVDEPVKIKLHKGIWEPKNYDKEFRGEVRLREALARSLNIPTVQLAEKIGIKNIARTGSLFGFGASLPEVPSLALGAGEVTPLELTQAYAILANGGVKRILRPFFYAIDPKSAKVIFSRPIEEKRIVAEGPVYILTDILRTAVDQGTGTIVRKMGVNGAIAGKTGTTNDARDSWFAGYTPRTLTTVWVGFDSNTPIKLTGAQAAAPIWASYMNCIAPFEPELDFFPPSDVTFRLIDRTSGLLHSEFCPSDLAVNEIFVKGTEPVTPCPIHSDEGRRKIEEIKRQ